ncbi:MAG: fumarylacetoacetase [Chlorobi bacterium]|nr:fumarylacetoacetase [Chlorobiota bacterium]
MIEANNPNLKTWIEVDDDSDFPVQNIPFGIFKTKKLTPRPATRIGNTVVDLQTLADFGYFNHTNIDTSVFSKQFLNGFIALGKPIWREVRNRLSELFNIDNPELRDNIKAKQSILHRINKVEMLMPVKIGDYTDFYSSYEHAKNVGMMFRKPDNAVLPNWRHLPVAYHGRSSSIVISGTNIYRPKGQIKVEENVFPEFGETKSLDFELEMAFITGKKTELGEVINIQKAEDYIFGLVIFNDLSARDIQKWEYVPLGPFLGKNFGSVISPWIVTLDALEPYKTEGPAQNPKILPYLQIDGNNNYDINLEVYLQPEDEKESQISASNMKYLYWNMPQQLAHHTVNGCNINIGDLCASGTISGPTPESYGSMLELAWKGTKPIQLTDGSVRKFVNDNDTIIMKAYAKNKKIRIGFGEVVTKILPAK